MSAEIADYILPYVQWRVCVGASLAGLLFALLWLFNHEDHARRRRSAGIDLLWTAISGASIIGALIVFGDLAWKGYVDRYNDQMHAAWDKLSQIDGKKLVSLNCPNGQPLANSKIGLTPGNVIADTPCVRANQILYWRTQEARHIVEIQNACPSGDIRFTTRDYGWTTDRSIIASCSGASACTMARCEQERAAAQILIATDTTSGTNLKADTTLSAYRTALKEAYEISMYDLYVRTHPIKSTTAFFVFIPLWAFFFGARLARTLAELIDPTGKKKLFAYWRKPRFHAHAPMTETPPVPTPVIGAELTPGSEVASEGAAESVAPSNAEVAVARPIDDQAQSE